MTFRAWVHAIARSSSISPSSSWLARLGVMFQQRNVEQSAWRRERCNKITRSIYCTRPPEGLMRFLHVYRSLLPGIAAVAALCAVNSVASAQNGSSADKGSKRPSCTSDDSGLKFPAGFCAPVFAEGMGPPRHMVVTPGGVVYVNT